MHVMPNPPPTAIGSWDSQTFWVALNPRDTPAEYSGVYRYKWNQWKGRELGTSDPEAPPIGFQMTDVETTPNTALAIWNSKSGELIATNGEIQALNPDTIVQNEWAGFSGSSYLPTQYPNPYISVNVPV
ncbi:hypothetical protein HDU86_003057 [Geranomyces michiganensis]|nr:hypothetical protein HDU86_003057 [Geranomyces michiganensis]